MVGFIFSITSLFLIKKQTYDITVQILHDGPGEGMDPRRARHNRALTTLKFLPFVASVYILIASVQISFSQTKRETCLKVVILSNPKADNIFCLFYSHSDTVADGHVYKCPTNIHAVYSTLHPKAESTCKKLHQENIHGYVVHAHFFGI